MCRLQGPWILKALVCFLPCIECNYSSHFYHIWESLSFLSHYVSPASLSLWLSQIIRASFSPGFTLMLSVTRSFPGLSLLLPLTFSCSLIFSSYHWTSLHGEKEICSSREYQVCFSFSYDWKITPDQFCASGLDGLGRVPCV